MPDLRKITGLQKCIAGLLIAVMLCCGFSGNDPFLGPGISEAAGLSAGATVTATDIADIQTDAALSVPTSSAAEASTGTKVQNVLITAYGNGGTARHSRGHHKY